MYAIRRAGRDSFYAGRWSAPQIARTLLRGPEHIDEYVGSLDPKRAPDMDICLCGAVFVEFDRRALLFWTYDLFGSGPLSAVHKYPDSLTTSASRSPRGLTPSRRGP